MKGLRVFLLDLSKPLHLYMLTTSPLAKDLYVVGWDESCGLTINAGQQPASHFRLLL